MSLRWLCPTMRLIRSPWTIRLPRYSIHLQMHRQCLMMNLRFPKKSRTTSCPSPMKLRMMSCRSPRKPPESSQEARP